MGIFKSKQQQNTYTKIYLVTAELKNLIPYFATVDTIWALSIIF